MKKMFSVVLLVLLCFVGGCSCSNTYKFDSVQVNDGTKTTTYTCSRKDKEDEDIKTMCEGLSSVTIKLKDKDTLVVNFPRYEMKNEEAQYKIENGYLYLEDNGEWLLFAEYTNKSIIINLDNIKLTLKK